MKNYRIVAVLVLAFVAMVAPVSAQPKVDLGFEFHPVGVETERLMAMPYYVAVDAERKLVAFGFVEYSGEAGSWFTNHAVSWSANKYFGLRAEVGADDAGSSFGKVGPTVKLPWVPGFNYLNVSPLFTSGTPAYDSELHISWSTKSAEFLIGSTPVKVWSEGFIRTFRDGGHTYGQPQVWVSFGSLPFDYGVELEIAGADRTYRGGVRARF